MMHRRLRSIRRLINTVRSNSKNKTERSVRLRMLMENCREDLYGFIYNLEDVEVRFIDFLNMFLSVFIIVNFFTDSYGVNIILMALIVQISTFFRRFDVLRHREKRARREKIKTKLVLDLINKKELRKLDVNLQEWYMVRNDLINPS